MIVVTIRKKGQLGNLLVAENADVAKQMFSAAAFHSDKSMAAYKDGEIVLVGSYDPNGVKSNLKGRKNPVKLFDLNPILANVKLYKEHLAKKEKQNKK